MDSSNALTSCIRYTSESNDKSHPRSVTLVKDKSGFGFTLRHFIVYPPTSLNHGKKKQGANEDTSVATTQWKSDYKNRPMDTIFIREVKEGSPAHNAGLNKGDRIIAINNHPLSGKTYSDIIHLILKSGQTLRLLVVPKEDDILQLYFASSAYQPVHREHKQHKYLMPSYCPDLEQSNQHYRQSSYGTYPGRIHKKSKSTIDKDVESKRGIKNLFLESDDVNKDLNFSSPSHLSCGIEDKSYDLPLPAKCIYEGSCFSEDEGLFHHAKDYENEDILELQPPKLKSTVANLYYSLCRDQPQSNFAFASEENLNYPIYMSDFDDIVHCDNMAESKSISEALHGTGETISSHPISLSYPCDSPQYGEDNHSCDIRDSAHLSLVNEQKPLYYSNNQMASTEGLNLHYNPEKSSDNSSAMYRKTGDRNSLASDYDFSENPNIPSINIVAQRRHQFESGNLLAESMERMNLYRSELSRMSKPNHVRLVSSRTAEFETKTGSSVNSSYTQKSVDVSKKNEKGSESHVKYNDNRTSSFDYDSTLDHQNSNTTPTDDSLIVTDSSETTITALNDICPSVTGVVHRRKTVPVSSDQDECHIVRRISYLRATANDRMNIESDLSEEDETSDPSSPNKEFRIQKLKSFFGEKTPKVKQALVPVDVTDTNGCSNQETTEESKSIYGWVICKVVSLEGKRSSDRSWRHVWAILRDNILYLLKERREPSKGTITGDEHVINVKYSIANAANDYVKRKHVLRLMLLNGTEYLFQTESHASMMEWLKALKIFAREISELPDWLKNTSVLEKAAAYEQQIQKGKSSGQHHNVRKLVFRHRSPSEHSPSIKTRRASQGDELALTKIGVLWRDRMVQGWKKVHGTNSHIPKGASFGVKLENAPPGVTNEHIPLLVELCIQIVESRGLDTVGIYRVPGNNASVSVLTDLVNQGIDDELIKDPRWNDVNIVSSLLKAYFRKLPEPLLTSYLYPKFIQASETEDPVKRLKAIKHVLYHLPVHYFATLRYLMYHLKKVVEHSATNKMEARNLAIVFGPTLVRTTDNNMVAMVTDMPQQCYLIETMITYAEWLFEDCGDILPLEINAQDKRKTHPPSTIQSSALLSNINKLDEESLPHEMFTSFCNAASRHLRHRQKKKDPASYSKKRSGIIADDTDILVDLNDSSISSNFTTPEIPDSKIADSENLSDISFGSCSSLISGSSKSKQRSMPKEPKLQNGTFVADRQSSESSQETSSILPLPEEEHAGHRYNKLSALAQEKIKNFEQETKALLRRDGQRPRTSVCSPQVEWEQIEKEWQKAKLELEQEDLLDYLADDPSYLSCLLSRGMESTELSPPTEFVATDSFKNKNGIPLSSSSSAVTEISHSPNTRSSHFSVPALSESQLQIKKISSKDEKSSIQQVSDPLRTKSDKSDIPTSASQPILSSALSDRTSSSAFEEYSLDSVKCKPTGISNTPHSESTESKYESSRTHLAEKDNSEEASACSSDVTQSQTLS